jgi:hypothetical protein
MSTRSFLTISQQRKIVNFAQDHFKKGKLTTGYLLSYLPFCNYIDVLSQSPPRSPKRARSTLVRGLLSHFFIGMLGAYRMFIRPSKSQLLVHEASGTRLLWLDYDEKNKAITDDLVLSALLNRGWIKASATEQKINATPVKVLIGDLLRDYTTSTDEAIADFSRVTNSDPNWGMEFRGSFSRLRMMSRVLNYLDLVARVEIALRDGPVKIVLRNGSLPIATYIKAVKHRAAGACHGVQDTQTIIIPHSTSNGTLFFSDAHFNADILLARSIDQAKEASLVRGSAGLKTITLGNLAWAVIRDARSARGLSGQRVVICFAKRFITQLTAAERESLAAILANQSVLGRVKLRFRRNSVLASLFNYAVLKVFSKIGRCGVDFGRLDRSAAKSTGAIVVVDELEYISNVYFDYQRVGVPTFAVKRSGSGDPINSVGKRVFDAGELGKLDFSDWSFADLYSGGESESTQLILSRIEKVVLGEVVE